MKQLTTIIALFFTIALHAQKDSIPVINDSTAFISRAQIQTVHKALMDQLGKLETTLNAAKYNGLLEGIQTAFYELDKLATDEYIRKKKPVKATK